MASDGLPSYYHQGEIDPLDAMEVMGIDKPFALGSALKYLWRHKHKGQEADDLRKALFYVGWLIGGRRVAVAVCQAAREAQQDPFEEDQK